MNDYIIGNLKLGCWRYFSINNHNIIRFVLLILLNIAAYFLIKKYPNRRMLIIILDIILSVILMVFIYSISISTICVD